VEAVADWDIQKLLNEIKTEVDAIDTFPIDAEEPTIKQEQFRVEVLNIAVAGSVSEQELKAYAEKVRDEISLLPSVSSVEATAIRPLEISIELSEQDLRRYNLSFDEVVAAIRGSSINLPAGSVRAERGDIQIQSRGQAYTQTDFENIILVSRRDGTLIRLGDVAKVKDGFVETNVVTNYEGLPTKFLHVYISTDPNVMTTTSVVKDYLDELQGRLPPGIRVEKWMDISVMFWDRMKMLAENALLGLLLVYIVLVLFLRPLLAFWVTVGILIAFMGGFFLLPATGTSLNMISMFAFMLILGIVVDDAIIVGEAIYSRQQRGLFGVIHASNAATRVLKPVFFAVLSTMIAFIPMYFMPGTNAKFGMPIPTVVMLVLFFSLVECFLILPAHLAPLRPEEPPTAYPLKKLNQVRSWFAGGLEKFVQNIYRPFLENALDRYVLVIVCFVTVFSLGVVFYQLGYLGNSFAPRVPSNFIVVTVDLPAGTSFERNKEIVQQLEEGTRRFKEDSYKLTDDGSQLIKYAVTNAYGNMVRYIIVLERGNDREWSAREIAEKWREYVGPVENIEKFQMDYTINEQQSDIKLRFSVDDYEDLPRVSHELQGELIRYPGVFEVSDNLEEIRPELEIKLKPYANNIGISLQEVARQVRQGFYGEEAQRVPRGKDDIKVMVRYSSDERKSVDHFSNIRIRTRDGREVPFDAVAEAIYVDGYSKIQRVDRNRVAVVSAEIATGAGVDADKVTEAILHDKLDSWKQKYPGFEIKKDGAQQEKEDFGKAMVFAWIGTILVIYALMTLPFRSFWQPFIIMTAVPFGYIGAVVGHAVFDKEISMFSLLGITAAIGVVVNDNLVLIDRINELREQGANIRRAAVQGAVDRFRPIILTSLTTFIGLLPMMFEKSTQALFLVPMVISLAFGVALASFVTLILVPSLYVMGEYAKETMRIAPNNTHFSTRPD
jgi:multidrug efflux pump subunit AcrB